VRRLFSFVATLQENRIVGGFAFPFIYFALIPKYIDMLDEVK